MSAVRKELNLRLISEGIPQGSVFDPLSLIIYLVTQQQLSVATALLLQMTQH